MIREPHNNEFPEKVVSRYPFHTALLDGWGTREMDTRFAIVGADGCPPLSVCLVLRPFLPWVRLQPDLWVSQSINNETSQPITIDSSRRSRRGAACCALSVSLVGSRLPQGTPPTFDAVPVFAFASLHLDHNPLVLADHAPVP